MTRFDNFQRSFRLTVAGITITLLEWVKGGLAEFVRDLLGENFHWLLLGITAAVLVILAIFLFEYAASRLIDWIKPLRRWIMGEKFVEGFWVDIVRTDSSEGVGYSGGILEIYFQKGELLVTGDTFDETGKKIGNFHSDFVHFVGWDFSYHYYKGVYAEQSTPDGYSSYHFKPRKPCPESFEGFYLPENANSINRVVGEKLESEVGDKSDEEKGRMVRDYIDRMRDSLEPKRV